MWRLRTECSEWNQAECQATDQEMLKLKIEEIGFEFFWSQGELIEEIKLGLGIEEIDWAQQIAIMATESKSLLTVPNWDGKKISEGMYILKLEAMPEYHDSRDAMDKTIMATRPTKSEYDGLANSNDNGDKKIALL